MDNKEIYSEIINRGYFICKNLINFEEYKKSKGGFAPITVQEQREQIEIQRQEIEKQREQILEMIDG